MIEQNNDGQTAVESSGTADQAPDSPEAEEPIADSKGAVGSSDKEQHNSDDGSYGDRDPRGLALLSLPFAALLVITILTTGAVGVGAFFAIHAISQHSDHVVVRVLIEEQVVELTDGQVGEFNAAVKDAVLEKHEAVYEDLESEVDAEIDALFKRPLANISDFVDWYYSMSGSVLRAVAWTQDGGAEFASNHFAEQVLDGQAIEGDIHLVYSGAEQLLQGLEDDVARDVKQALLSQFDAGPAELVNGSDDTVLEVDVTDAVREAVRFSNTQDLDRWRISARTAGAAFATWGSGVVAARAISHSPRISAALARSGQSIARVAGQRVGAAAVRGAATTAATAWTGPAAPFVGAGVTLTTWVGTEYAVLQHQRGTEGRDMEENLRVGLVQVRDQIKREITQEYRERIDRRVALLEKRLVDQAVRVDDTGDFYVFGTRAN